MQTEALEVDPYSAKREFAAGSLPDPTEKGALTQSLLIYGYRSTSCVLYVLGDA